MFEKLSNICTSNTLIKTPFSVIEKQDSLQAPNDGSTAFSYLENAWMRKSKYAFKICI